MDMHPTTPDELSKLPQVLFTADTPWDPNILDDEGSDINDDDVPSADFTSDPDLDEFGLLMPAARQSDEHLWSDFPSSVLTTKDLGNISQLLDDNTNLVVVLTVLILDKLMVVAAFAKIIIFIFH